MFLEHNDKDRKPEGDDMVTSWRCEKLMSCELTDVLTGNTHQATCPGCGGVSGNITGTHKDTNGSRYRDNHAPEERYRDEEIEYNDDKERKDKR